MSLILLEAAIKFILIYNFFQLKLFFVVAQVARPNESLGECKYTRSGTP